MVTFLDTDEKPTLDVSVSGEGVIKDISHYSGIAQDRGYV
jgi:hypothetical protein